MIVLVALQRNHSEKVRAAQQRTAAWLCDQLTVLPVSKYLLLLLSACIFTSVEFTWLLCWNCNTCRRDWCSPYPLLNRDLQSFDIRFEFESAARFDSIRKWWADSKIFELNRPCLPIARPAAPSSDAVTCRLLLWSSPTSPHVRRWRPHPARSPSYDVLPRWVTSHVRLTFPSSAVPHMARHPAVATPVQRGRTYGGVPRPH